MDNPKFCSGDSVVVLVTEQDFAFKINDLRSVPVVPVFLGGMGLEVKKVPATRAARQVQQKNTRGGYIPFFIRNRTHYIYIFIININ